ncbi:Crp/Fnr family transcriptional regulator [Spirochaetota bacterium]
MSKLFDYYGIKISSGEYIFREGDDASFLYMIHKGKVEISKAMGDRKEILQVLNEGEFLGEMAIIDSLPRSADAMALEDCELIRMDDESFDASIKDNHKFALSVIHCLSDRLRQTSNAVTVVSDSNRIQMLRVELLKEFIQNGKRDKMGKWILLDLDAFREKFTSENMWDTKYFNYVMEKLLEKGTIKLKKDQNKKDWAAYKI